MNGVLFRMLFGRSRTAHYQSLETHLSSIEEYLSKVANVKQQPTLHIQSFLLEEFHHASIAAYQAKDEINTTFNIYLVTIGLILSGLPFLLNLIFQTKDQRYTYLPGIFLVTTGLLLIIGGVLSIFFLGRFLQLTEERASSIQKLNDIKASYVKHLDQSSSFEDEFLNQSVSEPSYRVPQAIRYTVTLFGSAYFSGASFIFCIPFPLIIGILSSGFILFISFVIFQRYYLKQVARMSK